MIETSLAAWLRQHDESPYAFSRRVGIYIQTAYALCGMPSPKSPSFIRIATLERIAAETGIPVQQLYGDWFEVKWEEMRRYKREEAAE